MRKHVVDVLRKVKETEWKQARGKFKFVENYMANPIVMSFGDVTGDYNNYEHKHNHILALKALRRLLQKQEDDDDKRVLMILYLC